MFAALAVSHWIERTGWSIRKFVRTFRRYRQVTMNTGTLQVAAEQPLPDDERAILAKLHRHGAH